MTPIRGGLCLLIGYATIPIKQVIEYPGGSLDGLFEMFSPDDWNPYFRQIARNHAGTLHISLTARGRNSHPGECTAEPVPAAPSYANCDHFNYLVSHIMIPRWMVPFHFNVGDRCLFEGRVYECIQEHRPNEYWKPDVSPSLWNSSNLTPRAKTFPNFDHIYALLTHPVCVNLLFIYNKKIDSLLLTVYE